MPFPFKPAPKGKAGSRLAVVAQARRLAKRINIPVEEVIARRRAGLVWCDDLGWTTAEARLAHAMTKAKEKALAEGMCVHCRCRPATRGRQCGPCAEAGNAQKRRRSAAAKADGICVVCRAAPLVNASHCEACRLRHNAQLAARRAAKVKP